MNYIKVEVTDTENIREMSELASEIVRKHYDPILGATQNDYMIDNFQSVHAIKEQLEQGYNYYFVSDEAGENVGFIAFYPREKEMYLSKFYLHEDCRGKGISKDMLKFLIEKTKESNRDSIVLNVNKYNRLATRAYDKLGFIRIGQEKNDIGHGYYMDDYVYRYQVPNREKVPGSKLRRKT